MKNFATYLLLAAVLPSALAMPAATNGTTTDTGIGILACECTHNNDAGRWDDLSPSGRLSDLCSRGGGCHSGRIGRMCVSGDMSQCGCAVQAARDWESWHGNWFLWTYVRCGGLDVRITGN